MSESNGVHRKRKVLTRAEVFKLWHWLNANHERMTRVTRAEACTLAEMEVGMKMSTQTLDAIYQDMGQSFPGLRSRPTKGKSKGKTSQKIAQAVLAISGVLMRLLSKSSVGELLPDNVRQEMQKELAAIDVDCLEAIAHNAAVNTDPPKE